MASPSRLPHRVALGPADLKEGEYRSYELGKRWILVSRWGGALFAIDDQCNHAGCLLSGGWAEGLTIVCPCHEQSFDLTTGRNVTDPRLYEDQPVFPLSIENGQIVVELGP
jgi:3-phenylpropionate/trans-cinnamate dioxygenase ferredoxin subunit